MTIPELQTIAVQYGLQLQPVSGLESHCLFYDRTNKGQYKDTQLETMTGEEFTAICQAAVKPPPRMTPGEAAEFWTAEYEQRRPRRSVVTGRYK